MGKPEPLFGLREMEEGREGVLVGLPPPSSLLPVKVEDAMVVAMYLSSVSGCGTYGLGGKSVWPLPGA